MSDATLEKLDETTNKLKTDFRTVGKIVKQLKKIKSKVVVMFEKEMQIFFFLKKQVYLSKLNNKKSSNLAERHLIFMK